jgi:photosystem II stability/assembly factor-like uncharacterized protein
VPLSAVAAHGNTIIVGSGGGIAVSRDGGATYALATLPVQAHVTALALSPTFDRDPLALAATVQDGVLRSADGGATWHAWNFGLLDLGTNALALSPNFAEDATCFAATDHGVFMSSNSGRAWSELPIGIDNGPFTALAVKTHERAPLQLHLGTEGNGLWIASAPYEKWQRAKGLRADEINYVLPDVAATTKGVFVADGGKWAKSLDVEDGVCLAKLDDGAVIAGTAGNGVWHAEP